MSKHIFTSQVFNELYSAKRWRIPTSGGDISLSDIIKEDDFHIDEDLVNQKVQEKLDAEPMKRLRHERDRKLSETDWWVLPDRSASQEQKDYRQALRDLPSTAEPQLDENGQLTNVTWPTKPE